MKKSILLFIALISGCDKSLYSECEIQLIEMRAVNQFIDQEAKVHGALSIIAEEENQKIGHRLIQNFMIKENDELIDIILNHVKSCDSTFNDKVIRDINWRGSNETK